MRVFRRIFLAIEGGPRFCAGEEILGAELLD